jgi:hypothetical protein
VAAVLVLAVAAYFVLFAGGGSDDASSAPPSTGVPAQPGAVAEEPAAVPQQRLNAKSFGRDPFKALIVEAPVEAEQPAVAPVAPVAPAPVGSTSGTGGAAAPVGTSSPAATSPHSFRVLSVAPDNSTITVKVDGVRYANLRAGEVFANFFKVRLISGTSNSFQYGEERFNVLGNKRLTIA